MNILSLGIEKLDHFASILNLLHSCIFNSSRNILFDRLSASSSLGFIVGPAVGGFLYKHVDKSAPAFLASCIFLFNFILAAIFIPADQTVYNIQTQRNNNQNERGEDTTRWSKFTSFTTNLKSCFSSITLGSVIASQLIYQWTLKATSYSTMTNYYEDLFGIEPHQRGYLTSYQNCLSFFFQAFFVQSFLQALGGEPNATCAAAVAMTIANLMQHGTPFSLFVGVACPIISLSRAIMGVSLTTLVTKVAPTETLSSVLAALDVLQNMASVTVPFYRTFLFRILGLISGEYVGDLSPLLWVKSSVVHWLLTCILMTNLLLRSHLPNVSKSKKVSKNHSKEQ